MLIVLMKLRLALFNADLGYRFGLSQTAIGKIMKVNIPVLSSQLKRFIIWPTKDDTARTLATLVRRRYPDCRAIIDCTECRIERPLAFCARSETYSHYKGTNTFKFLIGITPNGAVSFVSKCWGGRASDKKLIQSSGFLDKLTDGDVILADQGFLIKEDVARRGAHLIVPALTRGKKQLPAREAEEARQISRIRIHVEHAIGRMKVYRNLKRQAPSEFASLCNKRCKHLCSSDEHATMADVKTSFMGVITVKACSIFLCKSRQLPCLYDTTKGWFTH